MKAMNFSERKARAALGINSSTLRRYIAGEIPVPHRIRMHFMAMESLPDWRRERLARIGNHLMKTKAKEKSNGGSN